MGAVCGKTTILGKKTDTKQISEKPTDKKLEDLKMSETKSNTLKEEPEETKNPKKQKTQNKIVVSIDENVIVSKGIKNPREVYLREKALGQGSFGTVYLVKHLQLHRYFAMKVIKKQKKNKNEEENLMNEINILRKLDHPNILKITDFYNLKTEYNIITEYCQEGELFDEIKNNAPFNETLTGWYMKQILSAVCYCHNQHVIHRDLKPENILIVKRQKNGFHPIKIIDFGTAKIFNKEKREHALIGSAYYIAPEVLSRNYTEKCDVWSCGIIMYILLTGRPPFNGSSEEEIMKKIKVGNFDMTKYPWGIISKEAKDLIKKLLQIDPNKRINSQSALNHEWFQTDKVKEVQNINTLKTKSLNKLLNNLTKYRSDNILRCAVIAYLVHNSTQLNQAHEAVKLFNKIDKNGDGKITKEELYSGFQQLMKLSGDELKNQVDTVFNNIDNDHNGYIEYEEFVRAAIDKEYFLSNDFLMFAFNYFDRDHNGNITLEEIKNLFCQNSNNKYSQEAQNQLKKCFKEIDVNGDGELSFDEFVLMMKNIIRNE